MQCLQSLLSHLYTCSYQVRRKVDVCDLTCKIQKQQVPAVLWQKEPYHKELIETDMLENSRMSDVPEITRTSDSVMTGISSI